MTLKVVHITSFKSWTRLNLSLPISTVSSIYRLGNWKGKTFMLNDEEALLLHSSIFHILRTQIAEHCATTTRTFRATDSIIWGASRDFVRSRKSKSFSILFFANWKCDEKFSVFVFAFYSWMLSSEVNLLLETIKSINRCWCPFFRFDENTKRRQYRQIWDVWKRKFLLNIFSQTQTILIPALGNQTQALY